MRSDESPSAALTACVTLSWTSARSPPSHTMSAPTKRGQRLWDHDDLGARATAEHNGLRLSRLLVDLLPSGFERRGLILSQLVSAAALDRQA